MAMRRLMGRSAMTPEISSIIQYLPDLVTLILRALPSAIMKVTVSRGSSARTRSGRPFAKGFNLASVSPEVSMTWFALVTVTLGTNATSASATTQHVSATDLDQGPHLPEELNVEVEATAEEDSEDEEQDAVEHAAVRTPWRSS